MLETSGTTITDIKGGVVWSPSSGGASLAFDTAARTVEPVMGYDANPIALASGSFATLRGDQKLLILAVGDLNISAGSYARLAFGDSNNLLAYTVPSGWGMAGGQMHSVVYAANSTNANEIDQRLNATGPDNGSDLTKYTNIPQFIDSTLTGRTCLAAMTYDGTLSNTYNLRDMNGRIIRDTNYGLGPGFDQCPLPTQDFVASPGPYLHGHPCAWDKDPATGLATVNYMQPNPCMRASGYKFYGIAVFVYDTALPSGWESMALWTAQQWKAGKRVIHPGLL